MENKNLEKVDTKRNLCSSCIKEFATCNGEPKFGDGFGDDNVYLCNGYKKKDDSIDVESFQSMSEEPESTGLCKYCPLPEEEQGIRQTPTGYFSCEGMFCEEAYENYINKIKKESIS